MLSFESKKRYIYSDFSAQDHIQLVANYRFENSNAISVRQCQVP